MKECFEEHAFRQKSLEKIALVAAITKDYAQQGYTLTLRQLYYQLVSKGEIPNSQNEYDRLSDLVSNARRAGLIDWDVIEDRTRGARGFYHYTTPKQAIQDAARDYRIDLWADQDNHVEVWIEKDALRDIAGQVCRQYDVTYLSCRGYASDSELYRAAKRLRWKTDQGKQVVVLHLGDHDPSGWDMSRDNLERIELFGNLSGMVDFRRIALNTDQVQKFSPPPNPAKTTDSRYAEYKAKYGNQSWELDALEPKILAGVIESNILSVIDRKKFEARKNLQQEQRVAMIEQAEHWEVAV